MWAYDDGRGRRARDIPSSRPANYYDDAYERAPPPRSSRHAYPDPAQPKHSSHDRHRRKSALVDPEQPRPRRNTHGGVNVVASDDGSAYPYGGGGLGADATRDVYGSSYPGQRKSRHDVEHKTGDRDRRFREKRGHWENDEAEKLRRAKSYSPKRAAREAEAAAAPRRVSPQAPKSSWPEDNDPYAGAQAGGHHGHRSSKKGSKTQQYYDEDPYASYYASQAAPQPRAKKADRGGGAAAGYDYGTPSAKDMPPPPMGEHAPYKSSPLGTYPEADEKPSKHHRSKREKDYYGTTGYEDYTTAAPKAGTNYDRGGYGAAAAAEETAAPRRSRHSKHHDDTRGAAPGMDDYGYPTQAQAPRGRHRAPPTTGAGDYGDADPYDRAPPRPRHRQSMPPQPRSQYPGGDDPYDDPYAAPRRRATSVNYGRHGGGADRYGGGGDPRRDQYYDDGYGRGGGSPSGSGGSGSGGAAAGGAAKKNNKKSKAYAQQAGKLFMTHAVPVIKKEAVPFLTKAAQAYFDQQKR